MKKSQDKQPRRVLNAGTLILAAIVLLGLSQKAIPQWATNGNNINNTNSGNVGIGTTTPDKLFTVEGAIPTWGATLSVVRNTGAFNGFGLAMDATGTGNNNLGFTLSGVPKASFSWDNSRHFLGFVNFEYSAADFALRVNSDGSLTYHDGASSSERFRITASGNVGIGTTNPGDPLEVLKSQNSLTQIRVQNPSAGGFAGAALKLTSEGGNSYLYRTSFGYGAGVANSTIIQDTSGGDIVIYGSAEVARFKNGGNVGIGTATPNSNYKLDVNGNTNITGNLNVTGNINSRYQDVAEWVPSSEQLPTGTVVVLDATKSNQVIASTISYDTRVAGVISEQPGIALGEKGDSKVLVATTGRVRVKVDATRASIHIGDLLVTSDIPGVAMQSEPVNLGGVQIHRPGTLIGKALERLEKGSGMILVLLSLQ